jgi:beta-N-acetylhexosaminidase
VTLVRNDAGLLPLRVEADTKILCLEPVPTNVTPADTTRLYPACLAGEMSRIHPGVEEIVYPHRPERSDIDAAVAQAREADVVIVGTVIAAPGQGALVDALIDTGVPVVTVALRSPFDLAEYPRSETHICTYSGLAPAVQAAVNAMFGVGGFEGKLPAAIPGLYATGHGLVV